MRLIAIILLIALANAAEAYPFADGVVAYVPGEGQWVGNSQFNDSARALGRPYGGGTSVPDLTSLVTLGDGGYLTLVYDQPIVDNPRNPHGFDFIVFSNATFVGGDPSYRWQELAFVEISQDNVEWFLIPPSKLPSELVPPSSGAEGDTGQSHTVVRNYAEYTPTLALPANRTPEEFYTIPDRQSYEGATQSLLIDAVSGGGDAFDIAQAVRQVSPGVPLYNNGKMVPAGITWFQYVKITDALLGDSQGLLGEISAEIDAAAAVTPVTKIGEARAKSDGEFVLLEGLVSASFDGYFYLQQADRSAGIKIESTASVTVGNRAMVTGHLKTTAGDRSVDNALVTVL